MPPGSVSLAILISFSSLITGQTFPHLPHLNALIRWKRETTSRPGNTSGSNQHLTFEPITNQFRCPNEESDTLMLTYFDCQTSDFVKYLLLQCQAKTIIQCRRNFHSDSKQNDDECYLAPHTHMTVRYYCVPRENSFNMCGQNQWVTTAEPSALVYSGSPPTYPQETPCVCSVSKVPGVKVILYNYEPSENLTSQLVLDGTVIRQFTEFAGHHLPTIRRYDGFVAWLSGDEAPQYFIAAIEGRAPVRIACGSVNAWIKGPRPQVTSLTKTNLRLSCFFSRSSDVWWLHKFGVAFSTRNTESSVTKGLITEAVYCQRMRSTTSSSGQFRGDSVHSYRQKVMNVNEINRACLQSAYKGDITFEVTVGIGSASPQNTDSQYHCFYEIFNKTRVSDYTKIPSANPLHVEIALEYEATVTCTFIVAGLKLTKFGLAFFTSESATNATDKSLDNSFHCHRGVLVSTFVVKRYPSDMDTELREPGSFTAYQVLDYATMEEYCHQSSFTGDLLFRISLGIPNALDFDPETKWHCFYEFMELGQFSKSAEIPFLVFQDHPRPSEQSTTGFTQHLPSQTGGPSTSSSTGDGSPTAASSGAGYSPTAPSKERVTIAQVELENGPISRWIIYAGIPLGGLVVAVGGALCVRRTGRRSQRLDRSSLANSLHEVSYSMDGVQAQLSTGQTTNRLYGQLKQSMTSVPPSEYGPVDVAALPTNAGAGFTRGIKRASKGHKRHRSECQ